MTPRPIRIGLGGLAAGALALVLAGPAGAHVSVDPQEVPAGGSTRASFTVGHGCDGSPTRELAFQVPEGILNASPYAHPGWDIAIARSDLDEPVAGGHGDAQTDRVSEIVFTAQAGNELPDGIRDSFTLAFRAPETPGEDLVFKVVQRCVEGETAWIEEPVEGGDEPDSPAPVIAVGPAQGDGHGHGGTADEGDGPGEESTGDPAAGTDDGGDSGNGLAVAGLAAGLLGLGAGGVALVRSGRS